MVDCKEGKQNANLFPWHTGFFLTQFPLQPGLSWLLLVLDQSVFNLTLLPLPLTKSPIKGNIPWVSSVKTTACSGLGSPPMQCEYSLSVSCHLSNVLLFTAVIGTPERQGWTAAIKYNCHCDRSIVGEKICAFQSCLSDKEQQWNWKLIPWRKTDTGIGGSAPTAAGRGCAPLAFSWGLRSHGRSLKPPGCRQVFFPYPLFELRKAKR